MAAPNLEAPRHAFVMRRTAAVPIRADGNKIAVTQGANTVTVAKLPGIYGVKDGDRA